MFYKNCPEYFQQSVLHLTPRVRVWIQIKTQATGAAGQRLRVEVAWNPFLTLLTWATVPNSCPDCF